MKGDITRDTYQRGKGYSSVRLQQGRVQVDSDWNEQMDIERHRTETETIDVFGPSGGPAAGAGFGIGIDSGKLTISIGHYYVHGILIENRTEDGKPVSFAAQPFSPPDSEPAAGANLVYAKVWERHIGAVEDPYIREKALEGPDTATRAQTIWQIQMVPCTVNDQFDPECAPGLPEYKALLVEPTGTLTASAPTPKQVPANPCLIPPGAGYTGLENQLYRVEIHEVDNTGKPLTFKWSRDNGSVLTGINGIDAPNRTLDVDNPGRDDVRGFRQNDWVEITDDDLDLKGLSGQIVQIETIDHVHRQIKLKQAPTLVYKKENHPKVRRWDGDTGTAKVTTGADTLLESNIHVVFAGGSYQVGDYWLIPARTAEGQIEWPTKADGVTPAAMKRHGIRYRFAPLAIADFDGQNFTNVRYDLRRLAVPANDLHVLEYLGGDGQECKPGDRFAVPLRVRVTNGRDGIAGTWVIFETKDGGVFLDMALANKGSHYEVRTDS
ncbi:MAG TPA: DUF6519 domain-containing protein, partial [Fimbriimonadaceae bacterium]|nr:DUF6519 domain-containing protein [Fimbriimonadaceae bacterium]